MAALPASTKGMTPEEKRRLYFNLALAGTSLIPGGAAISAAAKGAQIGTKAIPWLMRARQGLMGGRGWRKKAEGIGVYKGAAPGSGVPYTLSREGVKHGLDRAGRPIIQYPSGQNLRYSPIGREAPFYSTKNIPAGVIRAKPIRSAIVGAGTVGGVYPLARQLMGGGSPEAQISEAYAPEEPWGAPTDILNFADQQELLAEQGKEELSRMLKYGFGLAAAGAKTDKFFDRGMAILEQSKVYNESKHFADVVRAVYKEGDMPKNAREAYERLTPLVGPEQASVLSGHQLGMEEGKAKEERIWNKIMEIAQYGDLDGAAAELVAAWGTGRLKKAPFQTDHSIRLKKAREIIAELVGGSGLAAGVQNLERIDA